MYVVYKHKNGTEYLVSSREHEQELLANSFGKSRRNIEDYIRIETEELPSDLFKTEKKDGS